MSDFCKFCGASTNPTFSSHTEAACPKNPRNAPPAPSATEHHSKVQQPGSDFSDGGNPTEELPAASEPEQVPQPEPTVASSAPRAAKAITRLTEAEAKIKYPLMYTEEAVRRRDERKRCVLAGGDGGREALTDERIISLINRSREWNGVFDPKKMQEFLARASQAKTQRGADISSSGLCRLIVGYTSSRTQLERILGRSNFGKNAVSHAEVTTALIEAAKRKKRFDTRDRANVIWQWDGYLPLGKLVVIDGDPGLAKSMLSLSFGVSTMFGKLFMNGSKPAVTGGVLLLSAEDDPKDTIAPRLVAAGAPDGQIPLHFQPATKADGETFNLASIEDRLNLELTIADFDAKLVIIDPVNSYLGEKVESNSDQKIRLVLGPLSEIANRTGATIICLRHVKKSGGTKAIYQGLGSIGYTAAARANFYVAEHPDHNGTFVFAASKFNLEVKPPSLAYRIATKQVAGIEKPVPYVVGAGTCDLSADDLAAAQDQNGEGGKLGEAVDFLEGVLAEGPRQNTDVEKRADKQGIKPITLRRAKEELKIQSYQEGRKWFWRLPEEKQAGAKRKQEELF